jgi:hypothetical protein
LIAGLSTEPIRVEVDLAISRHPAHRWIRELLATVAKRMVKAS